MTRLKRIIMTLIKVKHPIFAPAESTDMIKGDPQPQPPEGQRRGSPGGHSPVAEAELT